jgi:hypothetical protein
MGTILTVILWFWFVTFCLCMLLWFAGYGMWKAVGSPFEDKGPPEKPRQDAFLRYSHDAEITEAMREAEMKIIRQRWEKREAAKAAKKRGGFW